MRLLFKYPSRDRPDWFKETLATYYSKLSGNHTYRFVITLDEDDMTMNNSPMREWLNHQSHLTYLFGDHRSKVEACNSDMPDDEWDIVILVSDDMVPLVHGFDDLIVQDMQAHFPQLDGVIKYPDGYRPKEDPIITFTIMGRQFYERYGFLYWPTYKSQWCDNELTDVAIQWGKYFNCADRLGTIRHQWQKHGVDNNYRRDHDLFMKDQQTYHGDDGKGGRKAKSFPVSYSQNDEDTYIRRYFKDQWRGRFLDIGAGEGVTFSNTKLLVDMGWSGVAIEPSPNFCRAIRENPELSRVSVEEAALMPSDGKTPFYHTPDFISTTNERHKATWEHSTTYTSITVNALSWNTLLSKYGPDFDFINLDIEGENVPMFQAMPEIVRQNAKMMCIEYDDGLGLIKSALALHGFKLIHTTGENVIMAKRPLGHRNDS